MVTGRGAGRLKPKFVEQQKSHEKNHLPLHKSSPKFDKSNGIHTRMGHPT